MINNNFNSHLSSATSITAFKKENLPHAFRVLLASSSGLAQHSHKRFYSSISQSNLKKYKLLNKVTSAALVKQEKSTLNPWFVTGLIDAEGTFAISILKSSSTKTGWTINARFKITMHIVDLDLILKLKNFWGVNVGKIVNFKDTCTYRVDKLTEIYEIIIPHFDKYPLVTQKLADYILFKEIVSLMINKEHLTLDGLNKIVSYKASLNLGLSEELKLNFSNIDAVKRPLIINKNIPSPFWMAGFTTGDGSFYLIVRANTNKINKIPRTDIGFSVTQHLRDTLLLEKFIPFFNCGRIKKDTRYSVHYFVVSSIKDITEKIIPFFKKYHTKGVKHLNFVDWCEGAELIKSKNHLSTEGVENIRILQNRMKSRRNSSATKNHNKILF